MTLYSVCREPLRGEPHYNDYPVVYDEFTNLSEAINKVIDLYKTPRFGVTLYRIEPDSNSESGYSTTGVIRIMKQSIRNYMCMDSYSPEFTYKTSGIPELYDAIKYLFWLHYEEHVILSCASLKEKFTYFHKL